MTSEFTVGLNERGERKTLYVRAEDALMAALKVKHEHPEAVINFVRKRNERGDRRHPHDPIDPRTA